MFLGAGYYIFNSKKLLLLLIKDRTKNVRFLLKNNKALKQWIGIYSIFFSFWAFYLLFKTIIRDINSIWFSIPLIIFIITSISGGYKIIINQQKGINLLIIAQIPQILVLQLNGFVYSMFIGQWIVIGLNGIIKIVFFASLLDIQYQMYFLDYNSPTFLVAINLVPIIIIIILLKTERLNEW